MSIRKWVCFVFALALCGAPAFADGGSKGAWELGVFGGKAFFDNYDRPAMAPLNLDEDFIVGARVGYWFTPLWSLEGSWQTVDAMTLFPSPTPNLVGDIESLRLNVLANFNAGGAIRPFLTLGFGEEDVNLPGAMVEKDGAFNLGGGLRWQAGDHFGLRWDARLVRADRGTTLISGQDNFETTIGASWFIGGSGPADADGDGVRDGKDRCPDTPRGATVDAKGCPSDSDKDGVFDGLDRCAATPMGDIVDANGCSKDSDGDGVNDGPDKCPDTSKGATVDAAGCSKDDDGDGVANGVDQCPKTPKGAKVDAKGCPKDSDGDGVFDGIDRCPDTPKGATVDANGCPADGDKDGVWDGLDRCPDSAAGAKVDAKGCAILFEGEQKTLVLDNVFFEFNSAKLTAESKRILDRVAAPLVQSFAGVDIEVAGHTDSVGSDKYNQTLSHQRAKSVVAHLVGAGVKAERLTARGYGESEPAAGNETAAGRAKNRRVELRRKN